MLTATTEQITALRESVTSSVFGVARYQGVQAEVGIVPEGEVRFRGQAEVQAAADISVAGNGASLVPKTKADTLAPYGQELALFRRVRVRSSSWDIPLGVYRITRAGDSTERLRGTTVLDWSVDVSLSDRFEQIRADDFLAVDAPVPGNTVWDEVRRLSPIPVQEALGDTTVPPATVYETRLRAVTDLIRILGGVPHLTREGVLTARVADAWLTSTIPVFDIPGVITWSGEMVNDFFNQVSVSNPNDKSIVAYASITDPWNPLSVSRAGGRTYKHSSTIYTDQAAAVAGAATVLRRVSERRASTVRVELGPEALLLELGDFGWVRDPVQKRAVLGEVSAVTVPLDPTGTFRVEIIVAQEALIVDDVIITPTGGLYPSEGLYPAEDLFPEG